MQSQIDHNTVCERCKQTFICNPVNIAACNCSKIQVSAEEISFIAKHYSNCVCNSCLIALKEDFRRLNKS